MLTVVTQIADQGISPKNSFSLLNLLLDNTKSKYLKIELSAYVEVLFDLYNLCYFLEGDGTDMPFRTGERLDRMVDLYSEGRMKDLSSTNRLIMEAID